MTDILKVAHFHMRSLVGAMQCTDAAAETINAYAGGGSSKTSISRKMAGNAAWTLADIVALQEATGRYPITSLLSKNMPNPEATEEGNLLELIGDIAKGNGEAVSAILSAEQLSSSDSYANAIKETEDAIQSLQGALALLKKRSGGAI